MAKIVKAEDDENEIDKQTRQAFKIARADETIARAEALDRARVDDERLMRAARVSFDELAQLQPEQRARVMQALAILLGLDPTNLDGKLE